MKLRMLLATAILACACSDDNSGTKKKAEGEACAVDSECQSGLLCRNDVCVQTSVVDCDGGDCGGDVGTDGGANNANNITPEDYYISYSLKSSIDSTVALKLYDTATQETVTVSPDGVDCLRGCWVNKSLTKFYTLATNVDTPGSFDVLAAPLDASKKAMGTGTTIATAVRAIEPIEDGLLYVRNNDGSNVAYYMDSAGVEIEIGTIGSSETTEGDAFVSPDTNLSVVFNPTLQTLDISVSALGTPVTAADKIYTIDSQNYQEVSGSYFGGDVPAAVSADGKYLAVMTTKAPLDTNACTDASDCTGVGERCGRFGRCTSIQLAIHFIELDKADNLGAPCSGDAACGPVHVCDIPADTQLDKAVCAPRRVVLGMPGQQQQGNPPRPGCELTAGRADLFYTDLRAPMSFGKDGGLYVVGSRDCGELNMPDADILRLTPTSSDYSVVFGNPGQNFDDAKCYNAAEQKPDDQNCVLYIGNAQLSPQGNQLAFTATNPLVIEPSLADSTLDIWKVDRDGTNRSWVGGNTELRSASGVRVHPR
ncbi:MAG: hypothetical protein R3E66_12195 [bacterium]